MRPARLVVWTAIIAWVTGTIGWSLAESGVEVLAPTMRGLALGFAIHQLDLEVRKSKT